MSLYTSSIDSIYISAITFPVAFGLAGIIIWLTISRIMTENREEMAA